MSTFLEGVVREILNPAVLLLAAGAFILFLWGVVKFIMGADDETKRKEGRSAILYGIIGLVIIFGVYGLLNLLTATFNLPPVDPISQ
jgi:hypothetical protein